MEDSKELTDALDAFIEENFEENAILEFPTGHANAILSIKDTGTYKYTFRCKECGDRSQCNEKEFEDFRKLKEGYCGTCHTTKPAEDFIEHPVLRATMSEQKILENLEEEFKDEEDPYLTAIEWYSYNIEGAYIGPGTPSYEKEFDVST